MQLVPEYTIAGAVAGILVLYVISKIVNSHPRYLAKKSETLDRFQILRSKSLRLQDVLSDLILSNNFALEIVAENFTYKDFLKQLKRNHVQNLSDKNYARIKNTHNRVVLMQAKKMIAEQELILKDAEIRLKNIL